MLGRLIKVTEPDGKWIAYKYDRSSNRTKMTVHLGGSPLVEHITDYRYNERNELIRVYDQLAERDENGEPTSTAVYTGYTYKDNGLVGTITYPSGAKTIYTYNSRSWLTTVSNQKSDGTVIAQFDYTYDPTYWGRNGTRTSVIENILRPDGTHISAQVEYGYDDRYRLIHELRRAYNGGDPGVAYEYDYSYDAAGNRTTWQVVGGTTTTYTYDAANKMTSPGTFTYDDKGNTLTHVAGGITTEYTWDLQNRMVQLAETGQTTKTYLYNADGMRVRKTPSGGVATDFLLDGQEVAEEITGSSMATYVGPRNSPIIAITADGRTIYSADAVGSTRAVTDQDQTVSEVAVYDAYGNNIASYPASNAPVFGFAGSHHYYQDDTGLQYLKYRYYDPQTGRFISVDPVRYGKNYYVYAGDRPTVLVDPLGLFPGLTGCAIGGGIGVVGGLIGGGGPADTVCRGLLGCAIGALAELACESSGGLLCKCAVGAGAGAVGSLANTLCSRLGKCPKPFDWKCALYATGIGALTGCLGKWVEGDEVEDVMMKVFLKLGGFAGGSACVNDVPLPWPPEKGF